MNKVEIVRISTQEAYIYAKLKIQIWNMCYNNILPKDYLKNISIQKKAIKYQNEIQNDLSASYYFVLVSKNPIGILRLRLYQNATQVNCMSIEDLYLKDEYQNKGYGGIIFQYIIKQAMKNNCQFITAWIIEQNLKARMLALKTGFKETGNNKTHDKTMINLIQYSYAVF